MTTRTDNPNYQLYTPEGSSPTASTSTSISPAHTFYSVHVMSYCQGTLGPVPAGATDLYSSRNVTDCSNRTILFAFNPTAAWPTEITHGPALEWPRVISDDFHAFQMTSRAMAVLYIIGVGAVGTVLLVKGVSVAMPKAQYGLLEFGFLVVRSFAFLQFATCIFSWRRSNLGVRNLVVWCIARHSGFWILYLDPVLLVIINPFQRCYRSLSQRLSIMVWDETDLLTPVSDLARLPEYKHRINHRYGPCF